MDKGGGLRCRATLDDWVEGGDLGGEIGGLWNSAINRILIFRTFEKSIPSPS